MAITDTVNVESDKEMRLGIKKKSLLKVSSAKIEKIEINNFKHSFAFFV